MKTVSLIAMIDLRNNIHNDIRDDTNVIYNDARDARDDTNVFYNDTTMCTSSTDWLHNIERLNS